MRGRWRSYRGYFPRAVFFFGFGFRVLPALPGAGSFFGRFGDTGSLLPWLAVPRWLRARVRPEAPGRLAGRSARRYRSASPACQSTEPSRPRPETAIVNGCCKRARPAKVAPVRSAELEPGDRGIAAVPADDLPGEGVDLGRPGDSQLITSRSNNAEGIPTRASGTALGGTGSAWMPATAGCWLTAHADASDPSDDPSPREPVRRLEQRSAVFDTEDLRVAPGQAAVCRQGLRPIRDDRAAAAPVPSVPPLLQHPTGIRSSVRRGGVRKLDPCAGRDASDCTICRRNRVRAHHRRRRCSGPASSGTPIFVAIT